MFGRGDYQYLQKESICQALDIPFEEQTIRSSRSSFKEFTNLETRDYQLKTLLTMCFAQNVKTKHVLTFQPKKLIIFFTTKKFKTISDVFNNPLKERKLTKTFFVEDGMHCITGKKSSDYEAEKLFLSLQKKLQQSKSTRAEPDFKKSRNHFSYGITVISSGWLMQLSKISFRVSFHTKSIDK